MSPLLVFDLGNVILNVDFGRFARSVANDSHKSPEEVQATFCQGPLKRELDRGRIGPLGFAAEIEAWLGEGAPSQEEILEAWTDIFSLKQGAEGFLVRYRLKYPTWLMSDTDPAHFTAALNNFALVRRFDRFIVSFRQGLLKREEGAFQLLAQFVVRGRKVILIDDLEVNVTAAQNAGLEAILFKSWEQLPKDLSDRGVW